AEVFLQTTDMLRSGDRNDVVALRKDPGQGQLRRLASLRGGERLDAAHQFQILLKIIGFKSREPEPAVIRCELIHPPEAAREEAAPERAVCHKSDAQLSADRENVLLNIACP